MIVLCTNKVSFLPVFLYHSLSRQVHVLVASRLTLLGSEDPFPVKDTRLLENQDIILTPCLVLLVTCCVSRQLALGCLLTQLLHSDLSSRVTWFVLEQFL